jgi:hypothetical protein
MAKILIVPPAGGKPTVLNSELSYLELQSLSIGGLQSIEKISGVLNFNSQPIGGVTDPSTSQQVSTKNYTDNAIAAAISGVANTKTFVASNAIAIKEVVYVQFTGQVELASATGGAGFTLFPGSKLGLATNSVAGGGSANVIVNPGGELLGFSGLTPGEEVYLGKTAGTLVQTFAGFVAGDAVVVVGHAVTATSVIYDPQFLYFL